MLREIGELSHKYEYKQVFIIVYLPGIGARNLLLQGKTSQLLMR